MFFQRTHCFHVLHSDLQYNVSTASYNKPKALQMEVFQDMNNVSPNFPFIFEMLSSKPFNEYLNTNDPGPVAVEKSSNIPGYRHQ